MNELYPTLIGLFGTISAISVAYLVLLYEQANKRREAAKESLVYEVNGSLHCHRVTQDSDLVEGNELRDNLLDQCRVKSISSDNVDKLQAYLKKQIEDLRGSDISTVESSVAGDRAKRARHIEKYHHDDTKKALDEFTKSEQFYNAFPATSRLAVGVPLGICAYFILVVRFSSVITDPVTLSRFANFNAFVAIAGLAFVFWATTSTLTKLKGK